jgi:hypothetical protein
LLFEPPPSAVAPVEEPARAEKGNGKLARDFVRWCCSFGADFRNSPDITNLRFWTRKNKIKIAVGDESEILEHARALFLRRLEQLAKKEDE